MESCGPNVARKWHFARLRATTRRSGIVRQTQTSPQIPYVRIPYVRIPYVRIPYVRIPYVRIPYVRIPYVRSTSEYPFSTSEYPFSTSELWSKTGIPRNPSSRNPLWNAVSGTEKRKFPCRLICAYASGQVSLDCSAMPPAS
jgi:hypothetical protein